MTTLGARWHSFAALRPWRAAARRAVLAGGAWGVAMGVGLPVLGFLDCGTICLSEIAITTAIAVPAGILTIGPLAAFGRSRSALPTEVQ